MPVLDAECNVLEKSLFFQHADKELAVTKMIDPETSTLFFFNQTLKLERRTTEKKIALPEIHTSDSLKTDKSQTSRYLNATYINPFKMLKLYISQKDESYWVFFRLIIIHKINYVFLGFILLVRII